MTWGSVSYRGRISYLGSSQSSVYSWCMKLVTYLCEVLRLRIHAALHDTYVQGHFMSFVTSTGCQECSKWQFFSRFYPQNALGKLLFCVKKY
jgi:hypothetical protein